MKDKLIADIAKYESEIVQLTNGIEQAKATLYGTQGALYYAKQLLAQIEKESADGMHNS